MYNMSELDFFTKKVRLPYDLDGILGNNFNYENGSFYNQASSDYKRLINYCYNRIEDDLKMDLVDFVDKWLPILKAELIEKERNLNVTNTITNGTKDYLLSFTTLKYDYLSEWVKEKRMLTEKLYHDIMNEDTIEIEKNTIDLSDVKGTEKIIFLYKMGVFDFLKEQEPFKSSKNLLASAISGITGIDVKTVQSYINPIDNPTRVEQKNNPLNSTKTVDKVIQKLNSIGYIPIK